MNIYIVTSSLIPAGQQNPELRFSETLETFKSIRKHDRESLIIMSDVSLSSWPADWSDKIKGIVNVLIDFSNDVDIRPLCETMQKSASEVVMLIKTLNVIKTNRFDVNADRIFKLSGRYTIEDGFDLNQHAHPEMFVFKKRNDTWMNPHRFGATHNLDTRFFSLCHTQLTGYIEILGQITRLLGYVDTEHAHFVCVPKNKLVEVDRVYCTGRVASTNDVVHD